ncbi:hypothetical protein B0G76_4340 [Paraburkholderia sp. BL23I1N1]|uniref:hypothetical protein n=1 Tax=Paraburkholderia sp. BL23I1N1 TaxID=1938802 RepID=UPI000E772FC4|nr:hypothetical protein [Paraburkholderia sp. BL23I1N1]RKE38047.1 hypothetical protein B0G76_4340 [Paraburkholderia sp. BL23I1N1]
MKKGWVSAALAAILTVAATGALAQEAAAPLPASAHAREEPQRGDRPPGPHGQHGPNGPIGPGFAVVNDLEQLRRLYAMSGREGEIVAVYHEVLNKTQDPMLRHYVYDSLAREQLKPANTDAAIATLRTSLSEDLVAVNKPPRGMPAGIQPSAQPQ